MQSTKALNPANTKITNTIQKIPPSVRPHKPEINTEKEQQKEETCHFLAMFVFFWSANPGWGIMLFVVFFFGIQRFLCSAPGRRIVKCPPSYGMGHCDVVILSSLSRVVLKRKRCRHGCGNCGSRAAGFIVARRCAGTSGVGGVILWIPQK